MADRVGRDADGKIARRNRNAAATAGKRRIEGPWLTTTQQRELIATLRNRLLQRRDRGTRLLEAGACLARLERIRLAHLLPPRGKPRGFLAAHHNVTQHKEPFLIDAQSRVSDRNFRSERRLYRAKVFFRCRKCGGCGFCQLAILPKPIEFP